MVVRSLATRLWRESDRTKPKNTTRTSWVAPRTRSLYHAGHGQQGEEGSGEAGRREDLHARLSSLGYEWMALTVVLVMSVSAVLATANFRERRLETVRKGSEG